MAQLQLKSVDHLRHTFELCSHKWAYSMELEPDRRSPTITLDVYQDGGLTLSWDDTFFDLADMLREETP
jgi:hypothetical protein